MKVRSTVNFKVVESKIRAALGLYGSTAALKMEADAKKNAPWWPKGPKGSTTGPPGYRHTGNARNSIQGEFLWERNLAKIKLSGNMPYSVYLELAHEKRWAILYPTIQQFQSEIYNGYQKLVR